MANTTKGRPLPPLLPLEFCTVNRASKMLECEPEDLLHWAYVGATDLYLMADGRYAEISPLKEFLEIVQHRHIAGATLPGDPVPIYRAGKYLDANIQLDTRDVRLTGLCRLHRTNLEAWIYYSTDAPVKEWICILDQLSLPGQFLLWHNQDIKLGELYVVKSDLIKLHESITSGTILKTRFDDEQISKRDTLELSRIEKQRTNKPERLTMPLASTIYALSRLAVKLAGKDPESITDAPFSALETLTSIMLENDCNAELGYSLGHSTPQGLADVINKAKLNLPS